MGLKLDYLDGQTPIDEDEKEGLLIKSITNRSELDEFEQLGIEKAVEWSLSKSFEVNNILTQKFILELHKRMFRDVWKWAGEFRKSNKNIGVDKFYISIEIKKLIDDCKFWIKNKSFSEDEIAIRFSHRIVKIHPFVNGNGRHSRLLADILINKGFGQPVFTWGSKNLIKKGEARTTYLNALKQADNNEYGSLINFARQ